MGWVGCVLAAASIGLAAACSPASTFRCQSDDACGDNGRCEPVGYCSFPDLDCPSGWRYADASADRFAGECVNQITDPPATDTDAGTGGSTVDPPGSTGTMPTTAETTVAVGESSSSSTGPVGDAGTAGSETTMGIPPECSMPGDCEQCAGMHCCPEVLECYMSTECTCVLDCFLPGGDPVQCFAMCGGPADAIPLQNCATANCNAECVP